MLNQFVHNVLRARRYRGGFREKLSVWRALNAWTIGKRFGGKGPIQSSFLGLTMHGHHHAALDFLFREVFLGECYRFDCDSPRPVIIDCGANIGMSVAYFKHLYPQARITAFEANPHAHRMLVRNIEENKFTDVRAYQVALHDAEGEIPFFIGEDVGTLLGSTHSGRGGGQELRVPAQRLSTHLLELGHVDLVKMDVEGAETRILEDLCSTGTLGLADAYIIEYHHNLPGEKAHLSAFLKAFEDAGFGYHLRAEATDDQGFQDILIHFTKQN